MQDRLSPKNLWADVSDRFSQVEQFMNNFPRDVREILFKTKSGKLHFEVELQGYGYMLKKWDSITNRLALTIVSSALFIASALSMIAPWGTDMPRYHGVPMISVYGLWGAGIFLVLLLYSIIRRRQYK
jgi:ubiquinone biosynthesis protein